MTFQTNAMTTMVGVNTSACLLVLGESVSVGLDMFWKQMVRNAKPVGVAEVNQSKFKDRDVLR
jgi:hypothetical protein